MALSFSSDDHFLASLGNKDKNEIVLWDVETGKAICGANASTKTEGAALTLAYCNNNPRRFVTAGEQTLKLWDMDEKDNKIRANDVSMGKLKRVRMYVYVNIYMYIYIQVYNVCINL